ncbi:DUF4200 domain-containing protein [Aquimarina aquimarini]|uniref:DUF4200 domain-containing protein n=1 Tax=Aquimarina aquimarini TaxID=1191734 RepID=UPI001F2E33B5|nr:DUF4200 domain-containing protein [Aquimarina aquimarini]
MKKTILLIGLIGISFGIKAQNTFPTTGNVGIGTTTPKGSLHLSSPITSKNSVQNIDANLIIEGKSNTRATNQGASLGFVVPANTDGTNFWQQGRVLVTPDNNSNGNASGRMHLQTRYLNNQGTAWHWRDNLVLRSSGNVGIGEIVPKGSLHVSSPITSKNSVQNIDANLIIEGKSNTRATNQGASLGFVVPANTDGTNFWQQGRVLVTPDNNSNGNASGRMHLQTRYLNNQRTAWHWRDNLVLRSSGNVGIGTTSPDMKLTVNGNIHAKEVKIDLNIPAPDYVFKEDYKLRSIEEVANFIKENSHLPEIPSAKEFEQNGVMQAEMDMSLLKKIEELTLYTIQQQNEIKQQNSKLEKQQKEISELRFLFEKLLESKK